MEKFRRLRIKLSRIFGGILIAIVLLSSSAWENTRPIVGLILFLIGVIFVSIASLGRLWCSLYIGGYKSNTLITTGPYSLCRNPLYFFSFIGAMGMGFATGTIFFPFIMAAAFALYYPLVIKAEEHDLDEKYGKSFSNYLSTTPRFFPKIALFNEPDTYTVNPKIFRKDLIQAFGFIWTLGILKLIEELHNLDVLPALFKFY